jgi:uncharacterized protein (DUF2147 family)
MKKYFFTVALALLSFYAFAQNANDIVGIWMTEEKDAKIQIYERNDEYFGKLIWGKNMYDEQGNSKLDVNNPDEQLQKRPLENLILLSDFEFSGDEWEDGHIYDPKSGKTYKCYMELKGNQLEVTGYVGVKWLSRTVTWNRVSK